MLFYPITPPMGLDSALGGTLGVTRWYCEGAGRRYRSAVHLPFLPKIYLTFTNSQVLITTFLGFNLWQHFLIQVTVLEFHRWTVATNLSVKKNSDFTLLLSFPTRHVELHLSGRKTNIANTELNPFVSSSTPIICCAQNNSFYLRDIDLRDLIEVLREKHGVSFVLFNPLISFETCFAFLVSRAQPLSVHRQSVKPQQGYVVKTTWDCNPQSAVR